MLVIGIQDADLGEFAYNFNFATNHYYKEVDRNELLQKAFKTVIDELDDPYTQVLDASFKESMAGNDVNFGYGITIVGNDAYVSNVKDDSLGINEKDKIISINGTKLENMNENEIKDVYANTNDEYEVEIERDGEIIKLELNMSVKKIQNITSDCFKIGNKRIAYIKMNSFSLNSAKEFKKAFEELKDNGFDSLIIDLRDNLGGENNNMINIASLFLDSSKIICIDKYKDKEKVYYSKGKETANFPIVLLGNFNSASCSEILICALKEGCNATFIGTNTYGKGVGQMSKETPNYYYKVTAFEWLTPSGKSISNVGITPDIEVYNSGREDKQLNTAIEYLQNK